MNMYQIEVSIANGDILISQDEGTGETNTISVHPDQAELVCKWVMGAAGLLNNKEA